MPIVFFKAILNYKTSLINVIIIIMIVAKFKIYAKIFQRIWLRFVVKDLILH